MFLRTKNHLCDPLAVAEVDKNEPAVVATGGDPTAKSDFVAGVFGAEGVTMVGAVGHGGVLRIGAKRRKTAGGSPKGEMKFHQLSL